MSWAESTRRSLRILIQVGSALLAALLAFMAFTRPESTWAFEYFSNPDLSGPPVTGQRRAAAIDTTHGALAPGLPEREGFSVRFRTCFQPAVAGSYKFRLRADDGARLLVDEKHVIDTWTAPTPGAREARVELDDTPHVLTIEYRNRSGPALLEAEFARPKRHLLRMIAPTHLPTPGGECKRG